MKKVGAPRKGKERRVRVSFTIEPSLIRALDVEASLDCGSKSEVLNQILKDRYNQV